MKHINKLFLTALSVAAFCSCADDNLVDYKIDKPEDIAQYEYLKDYDALKSYVDRTANPNFKLGMGVTVSEFLQKGLVHSVACANFDEMTAGNAMKYSSCVSDNGSMNFAQVTKFVDAAKNAGLTIYGHTLAWHSQQNNKYLNSIIADKEIEIDPDAANKVLHIKTAEAKANPWDWELYYDLSNALTVGKEYTISMQIKASTPVSVEFWPGKKDGSGTHYLSPFKATEAWTTSSVTFTPTAAINRLRFCFGKLGGDLYFDDIVLKEKGSDVNLIDNSGFDKADLSHFSKPSWHSYSYEIEAIAAGPATWWSNLVNNSDCESDDASSFYSTESGVGPNTAKFGAAGTGADGVGRAVVVKVGASPTNPWDSQFFVKVNHTFEEGEAYKFSMKVKADVTRTIESQAHKDPGGYLHWSMVGSPNVTTEWKEYKNEGTISASQAGMRTIAFNLSTASSAATFYFDDIKLEIEESGNTIPLTPAEKKDTLTWAMNNWIKGMMEACGGYVTAWDVVNEALSGTDKDGDGKYDLQSVTRGTVSAEDGKNNFYWQDYLGDEDYVRIAVKQAREHFAASGGNAANLKLFINDYNLESDWDDNKKLKSLIEWIKIWESDGVTKIDGIGTQMHVSCQMNPQTQKSKEDHVVKMFELMAATGKLIKISELDMGLVDENGLKVLTEDVTEEQHKAMSEYYKFIIKKYFEIIPAPQRYGITQWAVTDSPASSSWRGGEPIGLWKQNYNRKHTYAGFADGLAGK